MKLLNKLLSNKVIDFITNGAVYIVYFLVIIFLYYHLFICIVESK